MYGLRFKHNGEWYFLCEDDNYGEALYLKTDATNYITFKNYIELENFKSYFKKLNNFRIAPEYKNEVRVEELRPVKIKEICE